TENTADNNSTSNINKSDLDQDEKLQIQPEIETSIEETSQNQTVQESVRLATDDVTDTIAAARLNQTAEIEHIYIKEI
ncbi:23626_t:CDS:2, partial [Entrophospora sp. SA101]